MNADQKKTHIHRRTLSRREWLGSLPALALAPGWLAGGTQAPSPAIPVERLLGFSIRVSDVPRSLEFYQGLFGMPVQVRQNDTAFLRIGSGPQFMSLSPTLPGEAPSIHHICLSSPGFDPDELLGALARVGIARSDPPAPGARGIDHTMTAWVRRTRDGQTPELYFADAQGLILQLQDRSYCGGRGPLGGDCPAPEPAPAAPRIALRDLSHFTVFVSDGTAAGEFYQNTMGLFPQAYQAATPALGVGDRIQFLMFAGGGGGRGRGGAGAPTPANIHHASFNMDGFETGAILETLTDYGLTPANTNTGPRVHYISLRMPNRGGAEGGTPELYFTDPDGLLMQIQDSSYCGGGGVLGNVCG